MNNALASPVDRTVVGESAVSAGPVSYAAPMVSAYRTVSANPCATVASAAPIAAEVPVESVREALPVQSMGRAVPRNALESRAEPMAVAGSVEPVLRDWLVMAASAQQGMFVPRNAMRNSVVRMAAEGFVAHARRALLAWKGFATIKGPQPTYPAAILGAVQRRLHGLHLAYFGFWRSGFLSFY
jgi:hypothetical protein